MNQPWSEYNIITNDMEPKIEFCELWSLWEADLWKMQKIMKWEIL